MDDELLRGEIAARIDAHLTPEQRRQIRENARRIVRQMMAEEQETEEGDDNGWWTFDSTRT
jgi:hypothetical protein